MPARLAPIEKGGRDRRQSGAKSGHVAEQGRPLAVVGHDDATEREAEQVAEAAARPRPAAAVAPPTPAGPDLVQRLARPGREASRRDPAGRLFGGLEGPLARAVGSPERGEPLPPRVRAEVEPLVGADLSGVSLHREPAAREAAEAIGARAFTHGRRIFLGPSESPHDTRLIAHEATHALQQAAVGEAGVVQRTPAEDFIGEHRDWGGLNIREDTLGRALAGRLRQGDYAFAVSVVEALAPVDRDDVGYHATAELSDAELRSIGADATGRQLLDRFYDALMSGAPFEAERDQADRIFEASPRVQSLSLVPRHEVERYVTGAEVPLVVRSTPEPRADQDIREGDRTFTNETRPIFMENLQVRFPSGTELWLRRIENGAFVLRVAHPGSYRLRSWVRVPGRRTRLAERTIEVEEAAFERASRAAAPRDLMRHVAPEFRHEAEDPYGPPTEERVREQATEQATSFARQFDQVTLQRLQLREDAFRAEHIDEAFYRAGTELTQAMIVARPYLEAGNPSDRLVARLGELALAVDSQLGRYTPAGQELRPSPGPPVPSYFGAGDLSGFRLSFPGRDMQRALGEGRLDDALRAYGRLEHAYDRLILARMRVRDQEDSDTYRQLDRAVQLQQQMREIEQHDPIRVPAIFHPHEEYRQHGRITEVPLLLFTWQADGEWHLKDMTRPDHSFEPSVEAEPGSTQPPHELFERLDTREHLPKGMVYYQLPGQERQAVETTASWALSDYLAFLAIALVVVGLVAFTGPGGAAAAKLWFLSAGVVGGLSAASHMAEQAHHGTMTAGSVALDVLQIVGALASAGTISAEMGAARAAAAARRLATPLTGFAARVATLTDALYVPLAATAGGSDFLSLCIITRDAARQFEQIDRMPGDEDSRNRARYLLFASLLIQGTLGVISVRGSLADMRAGRSLSLVRNADGAFEARLRPLAPELPAGGAGGAGPLRSTAAGDLPGGARAPVHVEEPDFPPRSDPNSPHHLLDLMGQGPDPNLGRGALRGTPPPDHTTIGRGIADPREAYRLYNEALAGAGDREVAIYYNRFTGEYQVRLGDSVEVRGPGSLNDGWTTLVHFHPNLRQASILRLPAPADFEGVMRRGVGREFVEFDLPGGGRGRTEFGFEEGRPDPIYVRILNEDGSSQVRRFRSFDEYESWRWDSEMGEICVDSDSPLARQLIENLQSEAGRASPARGGRGGGGRRTMAGGLEEEVTEVTGVPEPVRRIRLEEAVATPPGEASPVIDRLTAALGDAPGGAETQPLHYVMRGGDWDELNAAGAGLDRHAMGDYDRFIDMAMRIRAGESLSAAEARAFRDLAVELNGRLASRAGARARLLEEAVRPPGAPRGERSPLMRQLDRTLPETRARPDDRRLYDMMRSGQWDQINRAGSAVDAGNPGDYQRFLDFNARIAGGETLAGAEAADYERIARRLNAELAAAAAVQPAGPQAAVDLVDQVFTGTPELGQLMALRQGSPDVAEVEAVLDGFLARTGQAGHDPFVVRPADNLGGWENGRLWLDTGLRSDPARFAGELSHEIGAYEIWARTGGSIPDLRMPDWFSGSGATHGLDLISRMAPSLGYDEVIAMLRRLQ